MSHWDNDGVGDPTLENSSGRGDPPLDPEDEPSEEDSDD